jgi:uncharacterized membrane protein HdeD (DUF308 family)
MEIIVDRSIRHWWVFVLRGILFILLSIYIFLSPVSSLLALGFLFGLVIIVAGIAELLHAYQGRGKGNRGWLLFAGLIDLYLVCYLVVTWQPVCLYYVSSWGYISFSEGIQYSCSAE